MLQVKKQSTCVFLLDSTFVTEAGCFTTCAVPSSSSSPLKVAAPSLEGMKTSSGRCLALLLLTSQALFGQPGVLDLTRLANYANQPVPAYILRDNTPGAPNPNPITDAGATLGRVLFYD